MLLQKMSRVLTKSSGPIKIAYNTNESAVYLEHESTASEFFN